MSERIPKFIYLDMDRIKSITARMDEGYIKEKVEEQGETEQNSETLTGAIKGSIFGIGASASASTTQTEAETEVSQETRGLHHYHYNILESMLEDQEGDWFHDIRDVEDARKEISEGDIIKISGNLQISDFETSFNMIEGLFEALQDDQARQMLGDDILDTEDFYDQTGEDITRPENDQLGGIETIFSMLRGFLPSEYENMITGQLNNQESNFWSTLEREKLETGPTEILAKYEDSNIPECTIVARVDTITTNPGEQAGVDVDSTGQFGMIHHMADQIAVEMGLKVQHPAIAITPIAIYR
jgi:hypothetical protein